MRVRAQSLSERGAGLKQLADAWQPLCQTLNLDQKHRMHLAAMYVFHEVRGVLERRRMEFSEAEEGDEDWNRLALGQEASLVAMCAT